MTPEELAELQTMVTMAAGEIEKRLAASLNKEMGGVNNKIDAMVEVASGFQASLTGLPTLVQEQIEGQLKGNLTSIIEEVGNQFEAKVKAMAGGGGDNSGAGGIGLNLNQLLANSDKIIGVINAWKQPTTEQAMLAQMNFVMKWHSLLSKLEKGGGTPDEITKRITETFTTPTQE